MAEGVSFQTKPRLAQRMLERSREAGVPFAWVTGDVVYGSDRPLATVAGTGRNVPRAGGQAQREAVGLAGIGTQAGATGLSLNSASMLSDKWELPHFW